MATRAARMLQDCVFEGSLSMSEMDKQRRPYHKNCSCALHRPKDEIPKPCFHHTRISYSNTPSWNKYSLATTAFPHPFKLQVKVTSKNDTVPFFWNVETIVALTSQFSHATSDKIQMWEYDAFNIPLMLVGKMKCGKDEMWEGN
ncbi:hypothetical protein L1987_77821 [Smallanthus sonchifolius]|uniref:Uncharacterized protein n=1 Tax=Smallanthus sonchifolius TaxID=185202 RepID=A0ACB8ZFF7_9ASTR|nr:hypothetical protein L1987_77821 [Smallanthus sonchifolius]